MVLASPPLRFAAGGPGPIAGQRGPKSRTKRMILKSGRPVVCFQQKALPAMRITALGRLQREPINRALIFWFIFHQGKRGEKTPERRKQYKFFLSLQKFQSYGTNIITFRIIIRYISSRIGRFDRRKTQNRIRLDILLFSVVDTFYRTDNLSVIRASATRRPQLGLPRKHISNGNDNTVSISVYRYSGNFIKTSSNIFLYASTFFSNGNG